jgi:hypothetical protein
MNTKVIFTHTKHVKKLRRAGSYHLKKHYQSTTKITSQTVQRDVMSNEQRESRRHTETAHAYANGNCAAGRQAQTCRHVFHKHAGQRRLIASVELASLNNSGTRTGVRYEGFPIIGISIKK